MTAALEGGEWPAARLDRTLPPGKPRYPFYTRLGGPQGGKSRPHRDSIPDRPAHSQSLYRLNYPAHINMAVMSLNVKKLPALRQVHSPFQSQFSTYCDLVLPLSIPSIISFT